MKRIEHFKSPRRWVNLILLAVITTTIGFIPWSEKRRHLDRFPSGAVDPRATPPGPSSRDLVAEADLPESLLTNANATGPRWEAGSDAHLSGLMRTAMEKGAAEANHIPRLVEKQIGATAALLALEEDEIQALREKLTAALEREKERFSRTRSFHELSSKAVSLQEAYDDAIDESMKACLNAEDHAVYQRHRLSQQAQRVESEARAQLNSLSARFELSETQKDQLFVGFARRSSRYDPRMRLDGISTSSVADVPPETDSEMLIRAVLDAEQRALYEEGSRKWQERFSRREGEAGH